MARHLGLLAVCLMLVLSPGALAQEAEAIPGRPWTSIIPDPDKHDWRSNDRPGYRYRGMDAAQQRFYDYIERKRDEGLPLSWADRAMIRQMIAVRRWPDAPRPNEFWAGYMRHLRSLPHDNLNTAQTLMLTELMRRGLIAMDRPPNATVQRVNDYLSTGPFEARNWFERCFGRAEEWMGPWLDYQMASHGHVLNAPGSGFPLLAKGDYQIEYTMAGCSPKGRGVLRPQGPHPYDGTFTPGQPATIRGRVRVGAHGAKVSYYALVQGDRQETQFEVSPQTTPTWHPFEATVAPTETTQHVVLGVSLTWLPTNRIPVVQESLTAQAHLLPDREPPADGSAAWDHYVNETLAKLGYSPTPLGRALTELRNALAGDDDAWRRYVDEQQRRLGYDDSPEAAELRALRQAAEAGAEQWTAYVQQQTGRAPAPPAAPAVTQPDAPPAQPAPTPATAAPRIEVGTDLADGTLAGTGTEFAKPLRVSTLCEFRDLPANTAIVAAWSLNGSEIVKGENRVTGSGNVTFTLSFGGEPLPPGRYRVELSALGKVIGWSAFTVK